MRGYFRLIPILLLLGCTKNEPTIQKNGESIFKELLEVSIGDRYTPWRWEGYWPRDEQKDQEIE